MSDVIVQSKQSINQYESFNRKAEHITKANQTEKTAQTKSIKKIKKYSNRRLYDTDTSSHVTLLDIKQMVQNDISFVVVDAKTNEDLTRSILMQIIQEAENDGEPIFSSDMLKNIIRFYGPMQGMFGSYLDSSIAAVFDLQRKVGLQSSQTLNSFMQQQAPLMQSFITQYIEQSQNLFFNPVNLFGGFNKKDNDAEQPNQKEQNKPASKANKENK